MFVSLDLGECCSCTLLHVSAHKLPIVNLIFYWLGSKFINEKNRTFARGKIVASIGLLTGSPELKRYCHINISLARLLSKVDGIHVDRFASLKDWYRDALDNVFWKD